MTRSKLAEAQRAAEEALATLRDLAAVHQRFETEPESGAVIRFTKRYTPGGRGYSFAALRIGPRWYITGAKSSSSARHGNWMTFEELVEFIGDSKAWVSGDWTEIPTVNPEVPAEGNAELLGRAADLLDKSSGRDINEVAKELLELFRSSNDEDRPDGFLRETPTGARFQRRIYPDDV